MEDETGLGKGAPSPAKQNRLAQGMAPRASRLTSIDSPGQRPRQSTERLLLQDINDFVEGSNRAHGLVELLLVRGVVAAEVDGGALDVEKRLLNLASLGLEGLGNRLEGLGQFGVVSLRSQLLGPVEGQEEVGAAVVVFADLAGRGVALVEEGLGGLVEGVGKHACLSVAVSVELVAEGLCQSQELTEGVPVQVVFLLDLLDVLRGGAAGTGLEQAAVLRNAG